jgi:hypothetical protein
MPEGWTSIAQVLGNDAITHTHIEALMERNGIPCGLGGSKTYYLQVRNEDAARATELLKEDVCHWHYQLWLFNQTGTEEATAYLPPATKDNTESRTLRRPISEVLALPEYTSNTELGAVLRQIEEYAPSVRATPFLIEIRTRVRCYRDQAGEVRTGYDFDFQFATDLSNNAGELQVSSQVWDGGSGFCYLGCLGCGLPG